MDSKMDFISLGELIINKRKEKGYSQRKFAQISGLSNTTISRIENGETLHPDIETLKLLSMHLEMDESLLIKAVDLSKDQVPPKRHAKLNYYKQPIRRINRYSSVFSSAPQPNEAKVEVLEQQFKEPQASIKSKEVKQEKAAQRICLKGMRLITLRLEKNITQKELADALGLDKTLISQYEGEIIKPDSETVERLADYFEVTIDYLCGNAESPVEVKAEAAPPARELVKYETAVADSKEKGLRTEYLAIAKEAQKAGINPEDIMAFINIIKKNRVK